jgi:hypothetical protein
MPKPVDNGAMPSVAVDTPAPAVPTPSGAAGAGASAQSVDARVFRFLSVLPGGRSRGVSTIAKALGLPVSEVADACGRLADAGRLKRYSGRGRRFGLPKGGSEAPADQPKEAHPAEPTPTPTPTPTPAAATPRRARPGSAVRIDSAPAAEPGESAQGPGKPAAPSTPEPGTMAGESGGIRFSFLVGALCMTALPPPLTPGESRMIDDAFGDVALPPWAAQLAVLGGILGPRLARHPLIIAQWNEYRAKRLKGGKARPAARPTPPPNVATPTPAEAGKPEPVAEPATKTDRTPDQVAESISDGAF